MNLREFIAKLRHRNLNYFRCCRTVVVIAKVSMEMQQKQSTVLHGLVFGTALSLFLIINIVKGLNTWCGQKNPRFSGIFSRVVKVKKKLNINTLDIFYWTFNRLRSPGVRRAPIARKCWSNANFTSICLDRESSVA